MVHYNVWFSLNDKVEEKAGLAAIEDFLSELSVRGEVASFRLLRNLSEGSRTKMPNFHAIIEFSSYATFQAAMKRQAERGVRMGLHGAVVEAVSDFRVEIFQSIDHSVEDSMTYACEI